MVLKFSSLHSGFYLKDTESGQGEGADGLTAAGDSPVRAALGLPTLVSLPTFGTNGGRSLIGTSLYQKVDQLPRSPGGQGVGIACVPLFISEGGQNILIKMLDGKQVATIY